MSAKKKVSARTHRRLAARASEKLADDRERLAAIEPGGRARSPITVESSSQIEVHARSLGCLRCSGACRLDDHAAQTIDEVRLRVVRVFCAACGARRTVYFRIAPTLAN